MLGMLGFIVGLIHLSPKLLDMKSIMEKFWILVWTCKLIVIGIIHLVGVRETQMKLLLLQLKTMAIDCRGLID